VNFLHLVKVFHAHLLALYPAQYRQDYTEERQAVFELAAQDAAEKDRFHFLWFALCELFDLPFAALAEHLRERRWLMIPSLRTLLSEKPDRWGSSMVAGLPFFLSAAFYYFPALFSPYMPTPPAPLVFWYHLMTRFPLTHWALNLVASDSYWMPHRVLFETLQWSFGLLAFFMILLGWMSNWPRWSASWAGYGLIALLRTVITLFPQDTESLISILIWLVLAIYTYIRITRLSPLMGLFALLPFCPMFFWWLVADGILGTYPEAIGYLASALLTSMAVFFSARAGSFKLALILVTAVVLVAGAGFAYGSVYYSNAPFPDEPTPGRVITSTLGGLPTLLLVGLPVWATITWNAYRRRNQA
jgi:hypothetical protein